MRPLTLFALACLGLLRCADPPLDDAARRQLAVAEVKRAIEADLDAAITATRAMLAAAPAPDEDGWSASDDPAAVAEMRARWLDARRAYERVEGAIAVLFRDLDEHVDQRYDAFLQGPLATRGDPDLFDGEGVTGMHAVERILWADAHPERVVRFERSVRGYVAASFPSHGEAARRFREGLLARLLRDLERMRRDFAPLALDAATALRGVIGSLEEQVEKVELAATAEEESRYAQTTLLDMRANLVGARRAWEAFRPWLLSRGGADIARRVDARLAALDAGYAEIPGDALPAVPDGWDPDAPTAAQLATPYGRLRTLLAIESDAARGGSLVAELNAAADALGIPRRP